MPRSWTMEGRSDDDGRGGSSGDDGFTRSGWRARAAGNVSVLDRPGRCVVVWCWRRHRWL